MRKRTIRKRIWVIPVLAIVLLAGIFCLYVGQYYHAASTALSSLRSDGTVTVTQTGFGWLFDGPSPNKALIFYPGAKVEETAYAPLLNRIAAEGMDVFLVKMPFRLAFFGADKATDLISQYEYDEWYIGGHSLGGAMAADYAAKHDGELKGLILLAAYPTKPLGAGLKVISIYGSNDGVLNMKKLEAGRQYLPENAVTYVIEGGNHAQFGDYGAQSGDKEASISAEEQQRQTVSLIMRKALEQNRDNGRSE